jgi:hypothetical protein
MERDAWLAMKEAEFQAEHRAAVEYEQAQSHATPPEVLAALAEHELLRVRNAVARNPNTPADVLVALMERTSAQVLKNPAFSLLLLEHPALFAGLSRRAAAHVARSKACPEPFMDWVERQHPWGGLADQLLHNVHVPLARRRRIFWARPAMTHDGPEGRRFVKGLLGAEAYALLLRVGVRFTRADTQPVDPSVTPAQLQWLADQGPLGSRLALGHPSCPPGVVARFASGNEAARLAAVGHPQLPEDSRAALAADASVAVRAALVGQAHALPHALLLQLCADPAEAVRLAVARRWRLDEAQAAALLSGATWSVWLSLASDRTLPPGALDTLSRAALVDVRKTLAWNAGLTPAAFQTLGSDPAWQVRQIIASREAAPRDLLDRLRGDKSLRVRHAAQATTRALNRQARRA